MFTKCTENWYSELTKELVINNFYVILQLLPSTGHGSFEFIVHQGCNSARSTLTLTFHKVV